MNCEKCGKPLSGTAFCEYCGHPTTEKNTVIEQIPAAQPVAEQQTAIAAEKPENVVTGTVGALIGAAIGGASIILLSQLGYIASISGLILAICTLKGYELLGGKLSVKGMIISLVLMAIMPYLADRIDWAIVVMQAYADEGVTFSESFAAIPFLIEEGAIEQGEYIKNLLFIYGFALLGAFSTVRSFFKKNKK